MKAGLREAARIVRRFSRARPLRSHRYYLALGADLRALRWQLLKTARTIRSNPLETPNLGHTDHSEVSP